MVSRAQFLSPPPPTTVSDRASAGASAVGPTHPQALERSGVGGQAPGVGRQEVPPQAGTGGGTLSRWLQGSSPGARKDALQGAQAGLLGSHVSCTELGFCRSRADPGGLFPAGRNPQTYPLYEGQFRETFLPFFGARCYFPCREKVKLGSEPGL